MLEEAREAGLLLNPREVACKYENESFLKPEVTDPSNLAWWLLDIAYWTSLLQLQHT